MLNRDDGDDDDDSDDDGEVMAAFVMVKVMQGRLYTGYEDGDGVAGILRRDNGGSDGLYGDYGDDFGVDSDGDVVGDDDDDTFTN